MKGPLTVYRYLLPLTLGLTALISLAVLFGVKRVRTRLPRAFFQIVGVFVAWLILFLWFSLTVERSRFHAVLTPLSSPEGMEAILKERRSDVRRANHHCWAYRVLDPSGAALERSKDDGEVGHPGRVLLEILRRHDLEGALVVSRVFGGVKLGVGGVSRAFREAGEGAVAEARAAAPAQGGGSDRPGVKGRAAGAAVTRRGGR